MSNLDCVIQQLRSAGLDVNKVEVDTAKIVRVDIEGARKGNKAGWYRIWSVTSKQGNEYFCGVYGNHKSGLQANIEFDKSDLTKEDHASMREKNRKAQKVAESEADHKRNEAARRANEIFNKLPSEGHSSYLSEKRIRAFGVRFSRGNVVVPVHNIEKDLVGLQFIYADPKKGKRFLSGTPKSGAFHALGKLIDGEPIYIAEGYATAASIYMATNRTTIVAFDAGNLAPVAKAIHNRFPSSSVAICCDDDSDNPENPGLNKGIAAARAVSGEAYAPHFASSTLQ